MAKEGGCTVEILKILSVILSRTVVPKVCSADPKGSASGSQGISGHISVMATFKFTYLFLIQGIMLG